MNTKKTVKILKLLGVERSKGSKLFNRKKKSKSEWRPRKKIILQFKKIQTCRWHNFDKLRFLKQLKRRHFSRMASLIEYKQTKRRDKNMNKRKSLCVPMKHDSVGMCKKIGRIRPNTQILREWPQLILSFFWDM